MFLLKCRIKIFHLSELLFEFKFKKNIFNPFYLEKAVVEVGASVEGDSGFGGIPAGSGGGGSGGGCPCGFTGGSPCLLLRFAGGGSGGNGGGGGGGSAPDGCSGFTSVVDVASVVCWSFPSRALLFFLFSVGAGIGTGGGRFSGGGI